jgi:protein TonB
VDARTAATAEILAKVEAQPASPVPVDTSIMSATRPKVERPALEPLFTYETPEEEKIPDRKWMIWAGAAAAIVIVAVLLVVFLHPFTHSAPAAAQQQVVVQQEAPVEETAVPAVSQAAPPTTAAKPSAAVPAPNAVANTQFPGAQAPATQPQAQVSSGMMDAQLAAPSRISKDVKASVAVEEAPPSGFAPGGMESSGSVPGAAFGGQNKVQVVAGTHAISSGVAEGMLLRKIEPIYPKFAKDSRITGTVVLKATITKSGGIEGLQVLSGPKILAEAALNAVKFWRYRPYMLNNEPVEVQTTINVVFNLSGGQ